MSDFFDVFGDEQLRQKGEQDLPVFGKSKSLTYEFEVKYGVFDIGPRGNSDLEKIMSDCANGKKLLGWERVVTNKEGDTQVIIKYLIPKENRKKEKK
jgi:hypothetical protein